MAERTERHLTLSGRPGDSADDRGRVGRRVVLGGQSRQGGLADAVGSQHNCPRAMGVGEGGLQLLQRVGVLGDAPLPRHRRILLRWRGIAGE